MLSPLVREQVREYFVSEHWRQLLTALERGLDVLHAHTYTESILHPYDIAALITAYFKNRDMPLQRAIKFFSSGPGLANIYNVHPRRDMAHFEFYATFNEDVVLQAASRSGGNLEYWDVAFMKKYYAKFPFREPTEADRAEIRRFFRGEEWTRHYTFMLEKESLHSHVPVRTSVHPEILLGCGKEAIEEKGWELGKAASVAYPLRGYDFAKISFLLKKPEILLELDWEFDPDVVLEPKGSELTFIVTESRVRQDYQAVEYYRLREHDRQELIKSL